MSRAQIEPDRRARWAVAGFVLISFVAFLLLFKAELVIRSSQPVQVDELYFATCAARGVVAGDLPLTGCHDNKGPLIFAIYAGLTDPAQPYQLSRIKWVGFSLFLFNAAMVAGLVWRLLSSAWAAVASGLMLLCAASGTMFVALKTEPLGLAFVVLALHALITGGQPAGPGRLLIVGVGFGLSMLAKQSYLFAWLGLLASLCLQRAPCWPLGWQARLKSFAWLGAGVLVPFLVLALYFGLAGKGIALLASLALYPSLYADPAAAQLPAGAARIAWRWGSLAEALWPYLLLVLIALPAVVHALRRGPPAAAERSDDAGTEPFGSTRPLIAVMGGLVVMLLIAPIMFPYHLMPLLCLAIVPACLTLKSIWVGLVGDNRAFAGSAALGLPVIALLVAMHTWFGPAGRLGSSVDAEEVPKLDLGGKRFAYVVGSWPQFFTTLGLTPASDVMYPNALPEAPAFWGFNRPAPESAKGRLLATVTAENLIKLNADFARTPPAFIHVVDSIARASGTSAPADIPVLAIYISAHCQPLQRIEGRFQIAGTLYRCANGH